MSTYKLIRWSGLAAILGGLLMIPSSIAQEAPWSWFGAIGMPLLILGLIGIYSAQAEKSGLSGFLGFVMLVAGSVYLAGTSGDIGGLPFWMLGTLLSALGLILLAVGTFSSGSFPRWIPWLWIAGILVGVPAILIPSLGPAIGILASIIVGLGMAGAGYILWSRPAQ